jgi:hypothetical protein
VSEQTTNRSFDELTRGLASGSLSRGKAIKLMGAALVGGTLGSLGIGEAAADNLCKPTGKKCRKNHQCCSGNCSGGTCAAACLPDFPFGINACTSRCTSGTECCSGNCPDGCCRGRNGVICQCQGGSTFSTCHSFDCSDATALVQFCNQPCATDGGSAGTGHTCFPNGCAGAVGSEVHS